MREVIRYAWGTSSLGDFIVARSERGLVACEFSTERTALEDSLRARWPEADVVSDPETMADETDQMSRLIEQPGSNPGILLDPRGTPFELRVWSMLREIPVGETTRYGALAAKLGTRDARDVTAAIMANPLAILIPCHRVIKKDGSISGYRWGVRRKRALLARERAVATNRWVQQNHGEPQRTQVVEERGQPMASEPSNSMRTVRDFLDLAFNARHPREAAAKYLDATYRQHNPTAQGPGAFVRLADEYLKAYPELRLTIQLLLGDGDWVVAQSLIQCQPHDRGRQLMDTFQLAHGRIVEHWDVMREVPESVAASVARASPTIH